MLAEGCVLAGLDVAAVGPETTRSLFGEAAALARRSGAHLRRPGASVPGTLSSGASGSGASGSGAPGWGAAGPEAGPEAAGPGAAGPVASGSGAAGPEAAGPVASGSGAAGPEAAGPGAAEPGTFRFGAVAIGVRPRPGRDLAAVRRLRRLLADFKPAVVHAHGLRAGALTALALPGPRVPGGSSRHRPALVVTVHNAPPAAGAAVIYRGLEWLVARRADVLLCVAPDLAARMQRLSARTVEQAVIAAPEAPASGLATGDDAAPAPGAGQAAPVVLAVGRLAPQKGFDSLLAAAVRWQERRPQPVLMIAGSGPLAGELAGQASRLGVTARFLGQRDDVPALLAAADVFVLPSRWEGQPMILHEALRAGRPVVATAVGGVPGMTGADAALLVPPDDSAALAEAVTRVLDDPALADRLSRAATARAVELPGAADAIRSALDLYASLAVPTGRWRGALTPDAGR
ncbi:MAG: glycosyltransferase [Streptosporangiaceae bacterium]